MDEQEKAHRAARLMTKAQQAEVSALIERLTALAKAGGNVGNPAVDAIRALNGALWQDKVDRVHLNNAEATVAERTWHSYDPSDWTGTDDYHDMIRKGL